MLISSQFWERDRHTQYTFAVFVPTCNRGPTAGVDPLATTEQMERHPMQQHFVEDSVSSPLLRDEMARSFTEMENTMARLITVRFSSLLTQLKAAALSLSPCGCAFG